MVAWLHDTLSIAQHQVNRISWTHWSGLIRLSCDDTINSINLALFGFDLLLAVIYLGKNAFSELLLLHVNHFLSDRAQIKQVEQVYFKELVARQLIKEVLEFRLLSAKVGPQRKLHLLR